MNNLNVGMLALAALPGALVAQESTNAAPYLKSRPNVVMIYADDLGFGDLECYGAIGVRTPNVNRLYENGLCFTNAHAVASTSTPSRYSLLTGEYPWRKEGTDVAAGDAAMIISPEQYTVADVFKEAGYTTAAFGKWHLGLGSQTGKQDWNAPITPALGDIGFDYSYIMAATADRVPCVFIENGSVANYDPSAPIYVNYNKNFEGEPTGKDNPELLYNLQSSHGHNYSIVNGIGRIGYMKGGGTALWKDENIADSITTHAVDFIRENSDTPFFIYFATNDVHVPRFPHPRFRGQSSMGLRGDAIVQFDWSVGEIINVLEEQGLLENTLIILTSDNGPVLDDGYVDQAEELVGDHSPTRGLRGGKYSAFEGGTRVPFIVHWPAVIKEQATRNSLVSQIDFLDVMASIAGVDAEARPQLRSVGWKMNSLIRLPWLSAVIRRPQSSPTQLMPCVPKKMRRDLSAGDCRIVDTRPISFSFSSNSSLPVFVKMSFNFFQCIPLSSLRYTEFCSVRTIAYSADAPHHTKSLGEESRSYLM